MARADFKCPHCHQIVRVIPLGGSGTEFQEFESTADLSDAPMTTPRSKAKGFWAAEGTNAAIIGLFAGFLVWLYCWWYAYDPLWSVIVGLVAGVGLMILRVVLYAPPRPRMEKPEPKTMVIQVEQLTEDKKHWLLDEFSDKITLNDLRKTSKAVFELDRAKLISQATICQQGLSQPKARLILDEFRRLNLAYTTKQNRTILTLRGVALLRKVAALPA